MKQMLLLYRLVREKHTYEKTHKTGGTRHTETDSTRCIGISHQTHVKRRTDYGERRLDTRCTADIRHLGKNAQTKRTHIHRETDRLGTTHRERGTDTR